MKGGWTCACVAVLMEMALETATCLYLNWKALAVFVTPFHPAAFFEGMATTSSPLVIYGGCSNAWP